MDNNILLNIQVQASKDLSDAIAEQERKAAEQKAAIEADIVEQKMQAANDLHKAKEALEQSHLQDKKSLEAAIVKQKKQASKELNDVKVGIERIQETFDEHFHSIIIFYSKYRCKQPKT